MPSGRLTEVKLGSAANEIQYSVRSAHLSALVPVSQALWDAEFVDAVQGASEEVARMQKWVKQQLSVRAAQTLIVPDLNVLGEDVRWTQQ